MRPVHSAAMFARDTLLLVTVAAIPCAAQPTLVQVVSPETKVTLEPSASTTVLATPPLGAKLDVAAVEGDWLQVRLPADASGFERFGYVPVSGVRDISPTRQPAGDSAVAPADGASGGPEAPTGATEDDRPTVAVLDFEFGAVQQWWTGTWDIGTGIASLLLDELLQGGGLRLIERSRIDALLKEQDFSQSDRAIPTAAQVAKAGQMLGVRYFVTGAVTKFGGEQKQFGGALGAIAGAYFGGKIGLGGIGVSNTHANVGLSCRVVDAATGEIVASVRAEGRSTRRGLMLGGLGGTSGGAVGGGINMGSTNFQETILGEATVDAVKKGAAQVTAALLRRAAGSTQAAPPLNAKPEPPTAVPSSAVPSEPPPVRNAPLS